MRDHRFYAKLFNCSFGGSSVDFLGHVLSVDGLIADPRKTAAVAAWPEPRDVRHVRSFLGLAN